jgi:hypothetical protein
MAFQIRLGPRSGRTVLCNQCAVSAKESLRCSFCGRSEAEVAKLVAGPNAFICDRCVAICVDILAETKTRWGWLRRIKKIWQTLT